MTSTLTRQTIDIITSTAALMAKDTAQAQDVASHLGNVEGKLTPDVPLKVKPSDSVFSAARVAHRTETGEPTQVTLELAKPISMAALVEAFGAYDKLPRSSKAGELPRVSFDLQLEKAEREITLFASYESDNGSADTSTVSRLMLFRD